MGLIEGVELRDTILPEWFEDYTRDDNMPLPPWAREWILSRPPAIHEVMIAFPPNSVVRAREGFSSAVLRPTRVGLIPGYREYADGVDIHVLSGGLMACCKPEWLELIGCHAGITPEVIKAVLRLKKKAS